MNASESTRNGESVRSLADATPGELIRVQLIVFEFARTSCWDLGIRQGEVLRCTEAGEAMVTVVRKDGGHLRVPTECARFVAIQAAEEAPVASVATL